MKTTFKSFIQSGQYLIDEVKTKSQKNAPYFFDKDSMRFFNSRVLELAWQKNNEIYFITSEADSGRIQHKGSIRAFTVRKLTVNGGIDTIGEFQGYATKREAQKAIMEILN